MFVHRIAVSFYRSEFEFESLLNILHKKKNLRLLLIILNVSNWPHCKSMFLQRKWSVQYKIPEAKTNPTHCETKQKIIQKYTNL